MLSTLSLIVTIGVPVGTVTQEKPLLYVIGRGDVPPVSYENLPPYIPNGYKPGDYVPYMPGAGEPLLDRDPNPTVKSILVGQK